MEKGAKFILHADTFYPRGDPAYNDLSFLSYHRFSKPEMVSIKDETNAKAVWCPMPIPVFLTPPTLLTKY